jgi:hypothetical protein
MNCDDLRVVEFWLRDGGRAGCEWTRHPEYEVTFEEEADEQNPH